MSSSLSSGNGGAASSRWSGGIRSSSGRSGTSSRGRIAVDRPRRLDSKSRGGGSSLYMGQRVLRVNRRAGPRVFPSSGTRICLGLIVNEVFLGDDDLLGRYD